jgi:hypothetical protein
MKICGYCGRENPDDAVRCSECGTACDFEKQPEQVWLLEFLKQPISDRFKGALWCVAWVLVILIMKPINVLAAPLFPLGLLALVPRGEEKAIILSMYVIPGFVGWTIYILLSVAMSRTSKKGTFLLAYIVFCTVLALNVVGCKRTLEAAAGIH